MGAHHPVAKIPIDGADDFGANGGRDAIERVPDNIVALIHSYHVSQRLLVIPADDATIRHLSTTAGIKHGCIQRNLVAFDGHNFRCAFVRKAVLVIKELRLHCFGPSSISSIKNPSSSAGTRGTPVVPPLLAQHHRMTRRWTHSNPRISERL